MAWLSVTSSRTSTPITCRSSSSWRRRRLSPSTIALRIVCPRLVANARISVSATALTAAMVVAWRARNRSTVSRYALTPCHRPIPHLRDFSQRAEARVEECVVALRAALCAVGDREGGRRALCVVDRADHRRDERGRAARRGAPAVVGAVQGAGRDQLRRHRHALAAPAVLPCPQGAPGRAE